MISALERTDRVLSALGDPVGALADDDLFAALREDPLVGLLLWWRVGFDLAEADEPVAEVTEADVDAALAAIQAGAR